MATFGAAGFAGDNAPRAVSHAEDEACEHKARSAQTPLGALLEDIWSANALPVSERRRLCNAAVARAQQGPTKAEEFGQNGGKAEARMSITARHEHVLAAARRAVGDSSLGITALKALLRQRQRSDLASRVGRLSKCRNTEVHVDSMLADEVEATLLGSPAGHADGATSTEEPEVEQAAKVHQGQDELEVMRKEVAEERAMSTSLKGEVQEHLQQMQQHQRQQQQLQQELEAKQEILASLESERNKAVDERAAAERRSALMYERCQALRMEVESMQENGKRKEEHRGMQRHHR